MSLHFISHVTLFVTTTKATWRHSIFKLEVF